MRAGKVVLEVGGLAEWAEVSTFSALKAWLARPKYLLQVRPWLSTVAHQLPFHAIAVHSEQLDKIREEEVGSGKDIPNISQSDSCQNTLSCTGKARTREWKPNNL